MTEHFGAGVGPGTLLGLGTFVVVTAGVVGFLVVLLVAFLDTGSEELTVLLLLTLSSSAIFSPDFRKGLLKSGLGDDVYPGNIYTFFSFSHTKVTLSFLVYHHFTTATLLPCPNN